MKDDRRLTDKPATEPILGCEVAASAEALAIHEVAEAVRFLDDLGFVISGEVVERVLRRVEYVNTLEQIFLINAEGERPDDLVAGDRDSKTVLPTSAGRQR